MQKGMLLFSYFYKFLKSKTTWNREHLALERKDICQIGTLSGLSDRKAFYVHTNEGMFL